MVELETKFFGTKVVSEKDIIYFPEGIYGFTEERKFVIFKDKEESPFLWLQSIINKELAFVIMEPNMIIKNYKPKITSQDLELLGVNLLEECKIYVILTIPENQPEEMTVNLQGPILINTIKKIGRQVISLDDRHGVRMKVTDLMEKEDL